MYIYIYIILILIYIYIIIYIYIYIYIYVQIYIYISTVVYISICVYCLVRSCYSQLRCIRSIHRVLLTSATIQLINSRIASRLDHCNSFLCLATSNVTYRIQSVLNVAPKLIFGHGYLTMLPILCVTDYTGCRFSSRFRSSAP